MQHAWDSNPSTANDDECWQPLETKEQSSSRVTQGLCLLIIAAQAVALALFVSHAVGAEHWVFYASYAVIGLAFVGYALLRYLGRLGRGSGVPVGAVFVWVLSLLISLSAPSRRRCLLGLEDLGVSEPCEEGSSALWIALLLTTLPVLAPMPVVPFALLGQLVSLQHLIIGLSLPRPECSTDAKGPGGPLLGLPPIWVSTLQLSALAALLLGCQWHLEKHRAAEKLIMDYLESNGSQIDVPQADLEAKNNFERVVNEMARVEQACRELLLQLDDLLPVSGHGVLAWTLFTRHFVSILYCCSGQLKRHNLNSDNATDQLFRAMAMEAGPEQHAAVNAMSGWLEHSLAPEDECPGSRRRWSSIVSKNDAMDFTRESDRLAGLTKIAIGSHSDWRIGEWNFNALEFESEYHNVLQFVGFELLSGSSILQKPQLVSFLGHLERSYNPGNSYHTHVHGADMTNNFIYLAKKTELWQLADFADSTRAAAIIAALGHDVGHFGRNNVFLISSRHTLAVTYNDRSVLENFHASTLVRLLDGEYGDQLPERKKLFSGFSAEHLQKARHLIIALILGTDLQKHLDDLSALRVRLGAASFDPIKDANDQQQCLGMLFRAADIGHSAKEWELHHDWSLRVVNEFHEQGDEERNLGLNISPLCDRNSFQLASSQVGFLQFICLPTWKELVNMESHVKECCHSPVRVSARKSTSSSAYSSARGQAISRAASPRTGCEEHRLSAVGTLQLPSAAPRGLQFLLLPGAMSGSPSSSKVAPADGLQRSREESPASPARWLTETCLSHCEHNFQLWKKHLNVEMSPESVTTEPTDARAVASAGAEARVEREETKTSDLPSDL